MKAILACERNGGIGKDDTMPWPKQSKDLQRFKELTLGTTIVMGRKTWFSKGMPKPLPKRTNVVLSRSDLDLPPDVVQCRSIAEVMEHEIDWVIGGAGLFEALLPSITEIHLSHLRAEYECDTSIDLNRIKEEFELVRSTLCLTHNYEIWKRK